MPITHPMLMVNIFQSGAPHIHKLSRFATILHVVWSSNSYSSVLTSKASSKVDLLNDDISHEVV